MCLKHVWLYFCTVVFSNIHSSFLSIKFYKISGSPPESEEPEGPTSVEEVVRPPRSQFSEITVRFFEEFGINGYERNHEAVRQIEVAQENRVRLADVLPQYHEVADLNLPSYHEAINVNNPNIYRVEKERY